MNQLFALVLCVALVSCSGSDDSPEARRKQLNTYKEQLHDLEAKISKLQDEVDASRAIEYVNVKTVEVKPRLFEHFFEITGNVEADEEVNVSPEGAGKIIRILVHEGQRVKKGAVLASVNTDMLNQSIAEMRISLDLARTTYERQKNLWDQKIGSELQFLQAKSNKESLERRLESLQAQKDLAAVKSPVEGIVDIIYQKQGEIAGPQTPFAKVINIDQVKIYGDVAESYLPKIKKSDQVKINFSALSKEVRAPISQIGNYIDPNNRTFRIRIDLKNPDGMIKPNMVAVLRIRDYVADSAFVVPTLLIKNDFRGQYTYIVNQEDSIARAKKIYVKTGVSDNNLTQITEGLNPGMKIISEGFDQVVDGSAVKL